jgi:hypothetical protein
MFNSSENIHSPLFKVTIWYEERRVPCCDVRYDFGIKTMLGSSLSLIVCRRVHVLFTLFVFVINVREY